MGKLKLGNATESELGTSILEKTKKSLGFVPNMYVNMAHNPALLDAYTYAYNSFRLNSGFNPQEQEVIFLSVAYENSCEYCMAAHSFVADVMSNVPAEITNAIREGRQISDSKLQALSTLTRLLTANRGIVSQNDIDNFLAAGYTGAHVLGVIAGIGVKTMSNYTNHNTKPEIDIAFKGRAWNKPN